MGSWKQNEELWQKVRCRERGNEREGERERGREERGGGGAEEKENSRFRDRKGTTPYSIVETEQRVVVEGEL